jgi:hypothetical protein
MSTGDPAGISRDVRYAADSFAGTLRQSAMSPAA